MKTLELLPDVRYEVALKHRTYRERQTESGAVEYHLPLTSGETLIVPPLAVDEIKALNPAAGECFTISRSIGVGNAAVWSVERIIPQPVRAASPKPMAAARSSVPTTLTAPVSNPPLTTEESKRIFRQLVAVIDACRAAEAYSNQIDYPVSFGPEDIRAMAISGFIAQSRREAA